MSEIAPINLEEELKQCKSMDDLLGKNGLVQRLVGPLIEKILQCELDAALGYERHSREPKDSENRRNGSTPKNLKSSFGELEVKVPRDRKGKYEPKLVKKHERSISSFDDKIISMYAKGMTTRDIQAHVSELYGAEISAATVSNITEKVWEEVTEWRSRPLSPVYAIVYLDAIHYKVKEDGRVISKAAYTCLGVDIHGNKDILGIWVGESEGSRFWLRVLAELKNRGVQDILIACVDGLKGFPEAINAVFPNTAIQLCIIHMIRSSLKYVSWKNAKEFINDLKIIYRAPSESSALEGLAALRTKWEEKYPLAVKPWHTHWDNIRTFFDFPEPIRRIIYTTNAVEALHRRFRKVTKNRAVFPSDAALTKMLYLAIRDISRKWTMVLRDWKAIITCLLATYGDRLSSVLERPNA